MGGCPCKEGVPTPEDPTIAHPKPVKRVSFGGSVTITDPNPVEGASVDEPATITDPNPVEGVSVDEPATITHSNPIEEVGFDEDETETPLWKHSLMMAARQGLTGYNVGKGLTPAEPEDTDTANTSRYGIGYHLMVKSPLLLGGMTRLIGPRREDESEGEYLDRATEAKAPVIDAAVAWKNTARKRLNKIFVRMSGEKASQKEPARPQPAPLFVRGDSVQGSSSSCQVLDAHGNPIIISDSEEEAEDLALALEDPKPMFATAFDEDVWPNIEENNQLSAGELRETVDKTSTMRSAADCDPDP